MNHPTAAEQMETAYRYYTAKAALEVAERTLLERAGLSAKTHYVQLGAFSDAEVRYYINRIIFDDCVAFGRATIDELRALA